MACYQGQAQQPRGGNYGTDEFGIPLSNRPGQPQYSRRNSRDQQQDDSRRRSTGGYSHRSSNGGQSFRNYQVAPPTISPSPTEDSDECFGVKTPEMLQVPSPYASAATIAAWDIPHGLAELLHKENQQIAKRIYLLDNSGSTSNGDGKIVNILRTPVVETPCTRWQEISNFAIEQAHWNLHMGVPCEFILLNTKYGLDPSKQGEGIMTLNPSAQDAGEISRLESWLQDNGPKSVTPLYARLCELLQRIQRSRERLVKQGKRLILIIATDGLPTASDSGVTTQQDRMDLVGALRQLNNVNVLTVLRLCTDDDDVIEFYGGIDEEVELELDVLDDLTAEAKEVVALNPWITYSPTLHRIRESGTFYKPFDLLDEATLGVVHTCEVVDMLTRRDADEIKIIPDAKGMWVSEVNTRLSKQRSVVYDPIKQKMLAPIVCKKLRKVAGASGPACAPGCSIM